MSTDLIIRYFGWSCFAVGSDREDVVFDPFFRPMHGARWASLEDFKRTKLICITHGHYEHYLDAAPIAKETGARVVASQQICDHLSSKYKVERRQLVPIKPLQTIDVDNFKVTAFEWQHRDISYWNFFKGNIATTVQFAWNSLFKSPFSAPKFGFLVEWPGGHRVMHYGEGFNNLIKIEELTEIASRFKPDVLLAGMQLNFEDYVAKGVAALSPKSVVLFHPHEKLFERFRLKSSSPQVFFDGIARSLPTASIVIATPMSSFLMDGKDFSLRTGDVGNLKAEGDS